MKTGTIYSKAAGKEMIEDDESQSLKASNQQLTEQQLNEWLGHPVTITLLGHLDIKYGGLWLSSMNAASLGDNNLSARQAIKAKTVSEIINYASRRK